jgi:2',3'-cyclic-nucleotide 2'-phosphodiesterase (5'-nucleotidase family)
MGAAMDNIIGTTLVDLDGRFTTVRREESNLGNLVVDVWRQVL